MKVFSIMLAVLSLVIVSGSAQEYQGLVLSTPYPSQVVKPNEPVTLPLTVKSYGLHPQVVTLEVKEIPTGWQVTFLGAGNVVKAVYVEPDLEATLSLKLEPPANVEPGSYRFQLSAQGAEDSARVSLPIELTVSQSVPPQLSLEADLPILRGTPSTTFRYRATLKNDSDQELLVSLDAGTPPGFQARFKLAFGGQEVSSFPVKAGESKQLDVEITLPQNQSAGEYPLPLRAQAEGASAQLTLTAVVTGQPQLTVTTPDARLSADVSTGGTTTLQIVVRNSGSAPAQDVKLNAFPPSGWEITFDPESVSQIAPDQEAQVSATLKPSEKAIAGDYMVTVNAQAEGVTESARFRITVHTSALWGVLGIVLIAVALGVVSLAVVRFGRR